MLVRLNDERATKAFGERLGRALRGGECIELVGDIGAGKTTLTKGIAAGLGITDTVQSPTFTINRTYEGRDGLRLSDYDFYRLADPGIMSDELSESLEDDATVIVIEWGAIVGLMLPEDNLQISFESPDEGTRHLTLEPSGLKAERLMRALA